MSCICVGFYLLYYLSAVFCITFPCWDVFLHTHYLEVYFISSRNVFTLPLTICGRCWMAVSCSTFWVDVASLGELENTIKSSLA